MQTKNTTGLTRDPFASPRSGFFPGGDRQIHLEHLRHLSEWSRRILVVTGPLGIGKTVLYSELSSSLEADTKAARLSGESVNTEHEILEGIVQGFGLSINPEAPQDNLDGLIVEHVDRLEALGRKCVVMIDDAHLLKPQSLACLVTLIQACGLRVLLFGEAHMVDALDRAVNRYDLEWFEVRLTGFPDAEIREYIAWRFAQVDEKEALAFSDKNLAALAKATKGNPGEIDRMVSGWLQGGSDRSRPSLPIKHVAVVGAILSLLGFVYLFTDGGEIDKNQMAATSTVDTLAAPQSDMPAQRPVSPALETVEIEPDVDAGVTSQADEKQQPNPQAPAQIAQTDVPVPKQALSEPSNLSVSTLALSPESTLPHESNEEPVVATSEIPAEVAQDDGFNNANWLLRQNAEGFTLQLMSLSSFDRAVTFINRQEKAQNFAVHSITRNGSVFYVVTYGVFPTRAAAELATSRLPGELAGMDTWVRSFAQLHKAIKKEGREPS